MNEEFFTPLNFKQWIESHRGDFKPPVGNAQIWPNREFMVTLVGGPNQRADYHINDGEEFFYQLEGDMVLRILQAGKPVDIPIRQGDVYLLPAKVPHSPQRPANTLGMVIERKRLEHELDGFRWICDGCQEKLYEEFIPLKDITKDLAPVFERFYSSTHTTCKKCGRTHSRKTS